MTDPIADLLTRIRNALQVKHESVTLQASKFKLALLQVLQEKGFIQSFQENKQDKTITITLKYLYGRDRVPAITQLKRVSKPGRRVYVGSSDILSHEDGLSTAIISTNQGIMTALAAQEKKVGGEVLCALW